MGVEPPFHAQRYHIATVEETRQPVLANIDHWLNQWGHPIWEGIYLGEQESCEQKLAQAQAAGTSAFSNEDAQAAANLYLDFLDIQTQARFCPDQEEQTQIRLAFIEKLGKLPPAGELQLVMWARTVLTTRCLAHHQGLRSISEPEVSDLIELIPVDDLGHQSISYLAFWAYNLSNKFYLDYCYRLFLTDPFVFMVDFSRQRIKVMRALVCGNCRDEDIEKLIGLIPHQMHLEWFEGYITPECKNQGLWTKSRSAQLTQKSDELRLGGPKVPTSRKPLSFQLNF